MRRRRRNWASIIRRLNRQGKTSVRMGNNASAHATKQRLLMEYRGVDVQVDGERVVLRLK